MSFSERRPYEYRFASDDAGLEDHRTRWQFPRQLVESDRYRALSNEAAVALPAIAFTSFYGKEHPRDAAWAAPRPLRYRIVAAWTGLSVETVRTKVVPELEAKELIRVERVDVRRPDRSGTDVLVQGARCLYALTAEDADDPDRQPGVAYFRRWLLTSGLYRLLPPRLGSTGTGHVTQRLFLRLLALDDGEPISIGELESEHMSRRAISDGLRVLRTPLPAVTLRDGGAPLALVEALAVGARGTKAYRCLPNAAPSLLQHVRVSLPEALEGRDGTEARLAIEMTREAWFATDAAVEQGEFTSWREERAREVREGAAQQAADAPAPLKLVRTSMSPRKVADAFLALCDKYGLTYLTPGDRASFEADLAKAEQDPAVQHPAAFRSAVYDVKPYQMDPDKPQRLRVLDVVDKLEQRAGGATLDAVGLADPRKMADATAKAAEQHSTDYEQWVARWPHLAGRGGRDAGAVERVAPLPDERSPMTAATRKAG